MDTTTINSQNGNSGKKKNFAGTAATMAAGAAVGVAGTAYAHNLNDEVIEEPVEINEEGLDEVQEVQEVGNQPDHEAQTSEIHENYSSASSQGNTPQPITSENNTTDAATETSQTGQNHVQSPEGTSSPASEEPINPEEIAEAIISEEQIDPNDIDMAEVVNFDEIGTVYTVDGESYTAATFHDAAGNQLVMVDVDGDNTFDVVTDMDGNVLANANNMTVDDAEIGIADENTYLASNELDSTGEVSDDSIADDLLA